jgi:hypothetical protein
VLLSSICNLVIDTIINQDPLVGAFSRNWERCLIWLSQGFYGLWARLLILIWVIIVILLSSLLLLLCLGLNLTNLVFLLDLIK